MGIQREIGVAVSAAVVSLRGATPSSPQILITTSSNLITYLKLHPTKFIFSFTFLQPNHIIHFIISISIIFKLQISLYDL